MISSYCACISVEKDLIEKHFIKTREEYWFTQSKRKQLVDKIDQSLKSIASFNDEAIKKLHHDLQEIVKGNSPEACALKSLKKLFQECLRIQPANQVENNCLACRTMEKVDPGCFGFNCRCHFYFSIL